MPPTNERSVRIEETALFAVYPRWQAVRYWIHLNTRDAIRSVPLHVDPQ